MPGFRMHERWLRSGLSGNGWRILREPGLEFVGLGHVACDEKPVGDQENHAGKDVEEGRGAEDDVEPEVLLEDPGEQHAEAAGGRAAGVEDPDGGGPELRGYHIADER